MSSITNAHKIKGLAELQARFAKTSAAMRETIEGHALATCGAIMQEAQRRVPVVTGQLRSSAWIRQNKRGKTSGFANASCGYSAKHASFVHDIPYSGKTTKGLPGAVRNGKGYKWLEKSAKAMSRSAVNLLRAGISETLVTGKPVRWNVPALEKGGRSGFAASLRGPAMARVMSGVYGTGGALRKAKRSSVRGGGGNPAAGVDWLKEILKTTGDRK